jgi:hypothetical protein
MIRQKNESRDVATSVRLIAIHLECRPRGEISSSGFLKVHPDNDSRDLQKRNRHASLDASRVLSGTPRRPVSLRLSEPDRHLKLKEDRSLLDLLCDLVDEPGQLVVLDGPHLGLSAVVAVPSRPGGIDHFGQDAHRPEQIRDDVSFVGPVRQPSEILDERKRNVLAGKAGVTIRRFDHAAEHTRLIELHRRHWYQILSTR